MLRPKIFPAGYRALLAGILLFGLLAMTARNAIDPDLWWHLRTGQWIIETGQVPHSDPFSFTREGHAWVSHEWLSEVLFYQLWKHGGAAALIVFSALITTAGFLLLYARSPAPPQWAAAATILGALSAAPSWGVRPQMFTFTLASLLLWVVEGAERRPQLWFSIPPLFLLWLNLHAGFALAPALLSAYAIGLSIETASSHTPWQQARPILLRVLFVVIVCLLLVPINPSGTQLYAYPFNTVRSAGMRSFLSEWRSPDFHQTLYLPFLLLWLSLLTALASGRSRPKARMIAPLLLTAYAALDASRHIPIFVLLAVPVIAAALPVNSRSSAISMRQHSRPVRPVFGAAAIILMAAFAVVRWVSLARNQNAMEADRFPQAAVAFLHAGNYPRDLFVYYDWGGYAIWKLYPQYRVFVDGRADLYDTDRSGNDLLREAVHTVPELRTGWQEVLSRWNIHALLLPPSSAIGQALLLDPNWHVAFGDSRAILLLRTRPLAQNTAIFPKNYLPREPTDMVEKTPLPVGTIVPNKKKCFPVPSQICETKACYRNTL